MLFSNITNNEVEYPPDVHPNLRKLLERMLMKDPTERIGSMEEIKRSEWFSDVNWNFINQRCYTPAIQLDLYRTYIHEEFLKEDVAELNREYEKAGVAEPLFEFFKFEKPSCKSILHGKAPANKHQYYTSSARQPTELSQKDSIKSTKKTPTLGERLGTQKPFGKTTKKTIAATPVASGNASVNTTGLGSNKLSSNHISTLPDQPREIKKKITLVKRS